jgi:hypothetical protein
MDPYVVTRLITDTVCSAFEAGGRSNGASPSGVRASKSAGVKAKGKKKAAARR